MDKDMEKDMNKNMETDMDKEERQAKARKLALILSILDLVVGAMGIYAFYTDSWLISVFGGLVIAFSVVQIILGHQIIVPLLAAVIGWIAVSNFWIGICIGMCYEAVITGLFAYLLVAIAKIKGPPPAPLSEVIAEQTEKAAKSEQDTEEDEDILAEDEDILAEDEDTGNAKDEE